MSLLKSVLQLHGVTAVRSKVIGLDYAASLDSDPVPLQPHGPDTSPGSLASLQDIFRPDTKRKQHTVGECTELDTNILKNRVEKGQIVETEADKENSKMEEVKKTNEEKVGKEKETEDVPVIGAGRLGKETRQEEYLAVQRGGGDSLLATKDLGFLSALAEFRREKLRWEEKNEFIKERQKWERMTAPSSS